MDLLVYEMGARYVFDRAYLDFERLHKIELCFAYFVIRAKTNTKFARMYSAKVDRVTGALCDQIGRLTSKETSKAYPGKLRRVKYHDAKTDRTLIFLTNNMEASALDIAMLYKQRRYVELFFKWIKQHLKIKSFWGTSENAVKIQIYSAIITYCMVATMAKKMELYRSTYEILQVLGISLLDKTSVNQLFNDVDYNNDKERDCKQLKISLF
ncbi:Transposase, Gmet_2093 family [hydrothermal vent metagenome]|uniref:Transposase, Gmet_2093 family n=1 Tax=hydrothermal vent metagenome TaxID=652676 RepID=A0A3B0T7B1_9ZZZZ